MGQYVTYITNQIRRRGTIEIWPPTPPKDVDENIEIIHFFWLK